MVHLKQTVLNERAEIFSKGQRVPFGKVCQPPSARQPMLFALVFSLKVAQNFEEKRDKIELWGHQKILRANAGSCCVSRELLDDSRLNSRIDGD